MQIIDDNITLHLVQLKMESDKEHIYHCLLFCFHQNKVLLMHRIIYEIYGENVITIRTCVNCFKQFKNGDFDIKVTKDRIGKMCFSMNCCYWIITEDRYNNYLNNKKNYKKSARTFASI